MRGDANILWIATLAVASLGGTLALACATPFAALAALAAVHLSGRPGMALVLLCWAGSQAVGFGLLGYPCTGATLGWGMAMAVGTLFALLAARSVPTRDTVAQLALGLVAAFVAFEAVILFAGWLIAPGQVPALAAPTLLARQVLREAGFLVALECLCQMLLALALAVPAGPRRAEAAA